MSKGRSDAPDKIGMQWIVLHQTRSNGKGEYYLHSNSTLSILDYFVKNNVFQLPNIYLPHSYQYSTQ
jgi:hypothetical protein